MFYFPSQVDQEKKKEDKKDTTKKEDKKEAAKKEDKKDASKKEDKEDKKKKEDEEKKKEEEKKKDEPAFDTLANPARVMKQQLKVRRQV